MFKNYFKIAIRQILRDKVGSIINISGLAIGLTSVILIALYIKDELNYDAFLTNIEQIHRVNISGKMGEEEFYAGYTPPPAGKALMEEYPEIEAYTRIYRPKVDIIESNNAGEKHLFKENHILAVDSNFLQVLTYPLKKGNSKTCLTKANSIVISQDIANKYFGENDAMGKILFYGQNRQPLEVTGILEDITESSATVNFEMLIPVENIESVEYFNWSWVWLNMATYVKLTKKAASDPEIINHLESQFPEMVKTQAAGSFDRIGQPLDEFLEKGNKWNIHLQPATDVHLYSSEITSIISDQNDIKNIRIFGVIALFIIILACVNFMNLATAKSSKRAKEIGVRKVLGSQKTHLIKQFMTESVCYTLLAFILSIIIFILVLPSFNQLADKKIELTNLFDVNILLILFGLIIFTALAAGLYPSLYLTSFKPVNILKGTTITKPKDGFIRNGLVVFQFCIAIAMIVCTIIVYSQLNYTQSRDLGFDKENLLVINNTDVLGDSEETFRQEIESLPQIESATISTSIMTKGSFGDFYVPETTSNDRAIAQDIALNSFMVDDHFMETLNLKMDEGRAFGENFNDSRTVILNETAVKQIGWKYPIGQKIRYPGGENETYEVVGVLKDFNLESLHNSIIPFALFSKESKTYDLDLSFITLKLKPGNPQTIIDDIQNKWLKFVQTAPFDYSFLNSDLDAAYKEDKKVASIFSVFSSLSIFVACLGLFGLVAFTTQQRTKEIGVRKILGASVGSIVKLISKEFLGLIILAIIIATPIAWYVMEKWLQDFAYKIEIKWWYFIIAGSMALLIGFITLSFEAIKAAVVNPVKSLRTE